MQFVGHFIFWIYIFFFFFEDDRKLKVIESINNVLADRGGERI